MKPSPTTLLTFFALILSIAPPLGAADGKLEINQSCATEGCFPGDDPGFPVEITASGSYILTGNLAPADSGDGIRINAAHVTVDLNGFEIVGDDTSPSSGIRINSDMTNTEILNGTVRDFGDVGVYCVNGCDRARIAGLRLISNGGAGLAISGADAVVVRDSLVEGNGFGGIFLSGNAAQVSGCTVMNNTQTDPGIRAGNYSIVAGNVVFNNEGHGIRADEKSIVMGNVVTFSGQHGISLVNETLVKNNTVNNSNQSGGEFENIESCPSCTLVDNELP